MDIKSCIAHLCCLSSWHYLTTLLQISIFLLTAFKLADIQVLICHRLAQSDPLQAVVEISFSPSVDTVGSAIDNLLLDSGFQMAQLSASDPKLPILLRQPLPLVHRSIGPTKLITALEFLAGSPWILVIDPVNRLVSYELATVYTTGEQ